MESFFSCNSICRRNAARAACEAANKKRVPRRTVYDSAPPPPPPPTAISQCEDLTFAAALVDDLEAVLKEDDGEVVAEGEGESDNGGGGSGGGGLATALAGAAALRITLLARGTRLEREVRMRYVTVAAERLFNKLDSMNPIDASVREMRRVLLQRLLKAEKRAEKASISAKGLD